jgi:salicylate hydroxylase
LAAEPTSLTVRRYSDGRILAREHDFHKNIRQKYNAPFIDLHRVDLQQALAARARELGVRLLLGARVTSVDFSSAAPTLTTESAQTLSGDLVVGADGLWSKCRTAFLGRELPPLPTGDLAYRIVLKAEQITDPELREWIQQPAVRFWIGPRSHAVAYSLRAGREFNIVLLVPDDLPENVARKPGSVHEMRELFWGWDPMSVFNFLLR